MTGLLVFGFAFAVNSSLHSYLILAYAGSKKAAEDVGFYYAANAAGRFMGTLLSGLLYQFGGIHACLIGSALMLALCFAFTLALAARAGESRRPGRMSTGERAMKIASVTAFARGSPHPLSLPLG